MKLNNVKYRKAGIHDAEILAAYRVNFIHEVYTIKTHPKAKQLTTELIAYFRQSIKENSVIAWVAEYNNKVIGTSSLVIWKAPMSYSGIHSKGKRGYILNMFTLKEYRKKGIASVLLKKLLDEAKQINLEFVSLHATIDGIGVYKSMGFVTSKFPELKLIIK